MYLKLCLTWCVIGNTRLLEIDNLFRLNGKKTVGPIKYIS
jgi:hypothetical protein